MLVNSDRELFRGLADGLMVPTILQPTEKYVFQSYFAVDNDRHVAKIREIG